MLRFLLPILTVLAGCAELPLARSHASAGCIVFLPDADSNDLILLIDDARKRLPRGVEGLEEEAVVWAGNVAATASEAHLRVHATARPFRRKLELFPLEVLVDRFKAFDDSARRRHEEKDRGKLAEEDDLRVELRQQLVQGHAPGGGSQLEILVRSTGWFRSEEEVEEEALAHESMIAGLSSALVIRTREVFVAVAREAGERVYAETWGPGLGDRPEP